MKNTISRLTIFGLLLCALPGVSRAEDVNLDKIVVTPYGYGESLSKTAASVTVVTQGNIDNSNAQSAIDVLRPIPGIMVRDYYGNGAQASVDIAGFGEQAALNVLVLVDGRRVNDIDLSGVDWSQIPLDRVERIEVMRGGLGGVLYGDNASSGVINIITKKGSGEPKLNLGIEYGSYDMNKQRLSLGGGIDDKFSYWLSGEHDSTNGYRNNSFSKANNFASKLDYRFNEVLSANFSSGFNASTYGLPGALFQSDIDQHSRRYAKYGDDHANKKDYYFLMGPKIELLNLGNFDINFSFRHKNNDSYYLTSYSSYPTYGGIQKDVIKTFGVAPKYTLRNSVLNHDNKLIVGLDYSRTDYNSTSYALSNNSLVNSTGIRKSSLGSYAQDEFSILKQLALIGGYRYESVRYAFNYHDDLGSNPDQDTKLRSNQWSFNTGLVYTYQDDSSIFLNSGRSYRFPEIDEFNYFDSNYERQLNTDLKPQSAITYETGIRHKFSDRLKGCLSLFRMNVKDELYFNATGGATGFGQNENYDKTIHEGIESSLDVKLSDFVSLFGNYTFTNAYFDGGIYDKNKIPLVPQHKGSIGLRLFFTKNITLNVIGTYVGKKYALNDQANAYSRLNGYMTMDTNLSWRHKDLTVAFAVNNLFNKQYSEYAGVQVSDGAKFYYPSPERNFSLKIDYTF
ncbi:MAG: TonB-dependent receptor [Candidatus Omnitrophota bacterium]|jgi:iron complex outermembrane receptor protein